MFGWMTVAETLRFVKAFYPGWDDGYAATLMRQWELPERTRVEHLSKGQNVRLGLLLALAHRPDLVILDDLRLGLDPIMRKQFMRDVIDHLQGSGVTVFFSSHLLYEIEPVVDEVAILEGGRIVRQAETEALREDAKLLTFHRTGLLRKAVCASRRGRREVRQPGSTDRRQRPAAVGPAPGSRRRSLQGPRAVRAAPS